MCGIIAIAARRDVASSILSGLKHLEYRGYDSAGIATLRAGLITRVRAEGKLSNLAARLQDNPLLGYIGIGHTRWATHGAPTEANAHPHATDRVAVVHNGIIENFAELRSELQAAGFTFSSQTDTEVIPVLITSYLAEGKSADEAVRATLQRLRGAYALAILCKDEPEVVYGARLGAPLAIGYGEGEHYIGSDAIALTSLAKQVSYLEDGDVAKITADGVTITNSDGQNIERERIIPTIENNALSRGQYAHYMQKEIFEQPSVVAKTLEAYGDAATHAITLPALDIDLAAVRQVKIIACGTSSYAAQIAKYWLEEIARLPVEVDIASEYRYRHPVLNKDTLVIVISQSGETADTLAVLRHVKDACQTLAIVNVKESSIAREAQAVLYTHAGPEIGVASTKAFTTQLVVLACLSLTFAEIRKVVDKAKYKQLCDALWRVPSLMSDTFALDSKLHALAESVQYSRDMLYIGRGTSYAVAMEGALKMKEISYIHAEAYAAGELKHGPIALIDEHVPVVVIAPRDALFEKTLSNLQEAAARGGKIIVFTDAKGAAQLGSSVMMHLQLPEMDGFIAPMIYTLPVQLLAYHTAVLKGTDVDQPRNLAKSVTVE